MDVPVHWPDVLDRDGCCCVDCLGSVSIFYQMRSKEEKILTTFKLTPTPQRLEILRLILKRRGSLFTASDLKGDITHLSVAISDATLVTTIQLFHTRHILVGSSGFHGEKGRPPMQYSITRQVMDMPEMGGNTESDLPFVK